MADYTTDELEQTRRPIASLISKSKKAQERLLPGTWQHTMLGANLKALQIASVFMNNDASDTDKFTPDDLHKAVRALSSMIDRTEKAHAKFWPGTAQHTLQRNRLNALRIAKARTEVKIRDQERPNQATQRTEARPIRTLCVIS